MLDFLSTISDSVVSLFSFLGSSLQNLFQVFGLFGQASAFLYRIIALLPPFVVPFAIAVVVISIVFMIIGR